MNAERIELRRAGAIVKAIETVMSPKPIQSMIAAFCETREEAEALYNLALSRSEQSIES